MDPALLCSSTSSHLLPRGMWQPRVARTPQGVHLCKHEHTVRDPHQYDLLKNLRGRLCVFPLRSTSARLGLGASCTNVFVDGMLCTEPVRVLDAVDLLTIYARRDVEHRSQERGVLHVPVPARS
jgi:hypothetical protein